MYKIEQKIGIYALTYQDNFLGHSSHTTYSPRFASCSLLFSSHLISSFLFSSFFVSSLLFLNYSLLFSSLILALNLYFHCFVSFKFMTYPCLLRASKAFVRNQFFQSFSFAKILVSNDSKNSNYSTAPTRLRCPVCLEPLSLDNCTAKQTLRLCETGFSCYTLQAFETMLSTYIFAKGCFPEFLCNGNHGCEFLNRSRNGTIDSCSFQCCHTDQCNAGPSVSPPVPSTEPSPPVPSTEPSPPVPSTEPSPPVPSTEPSSPIPSTEPTPPVPSTEPAPVSTSSQPTITTTQGPMTPTTASTSIPGIVSRIIFQLLPVTYKTHHGLSPACLLCNTRM